MYYTRDHEWIDFQGSGAYVGVSNFKLSGWIFSIIPTNYYDREDLIPINEYMTLIKNEFPK